MLQIGGQQWLRRPRPQWGTMLQGGTQRTLSDAEKKEAPARAWTVLLDCLRLLTSADNFSKDETSILTSHLFPKEVLATDYP